MISPARELLARYVDHHEPNDPRHERKQQHPKEYTHSYLIDEGLTPGWHPGLKCPAGRATDRIEAHFLTTLLAELRCGHACFPCPIRHQIIVSTKHEIDLPIGILHLRKGIDRPASPSTASSGRRNAQKGLITLLRALALRWGRCALLPIHLSGHPSG